MKTKTISRRTDPVFCGTLIAAAHLFTACFLLPLTSAAQSGTLDLTFNGTGIVTTPAVSNLYTTNATAIQSDGKIVVAGGSTNGTNYHFAVVRYGNNISTGINPTAEQTTEINIYPNPAGNQLAIGSKQFAIKEIEIYDALGNGIGNWQLVPINIGSNNSINVPY